VQQAVVVGRCGRRDHDEAGHVREPRFERLRVLRGGGAPQPVRHARDERHPALPAEHVARLRRLVHHLVHRAEREVDHAHLDHWFQAVQRHADRRAHDGRFGDRRVDNALRSELLREPAVLSEDPAAADVLAECNDPRIGTHRLRERGARGLGVGEARHVQYHRPAPVS
jgi:hypothetical protein